jgi:hypothetical protein
MERIKADQAKAFWAKPEASLVQSVFIPGIQFNPCAGFDVNL